MFAEIMKRLIRSLYGRQIRGEQSVNDMRISQPGISLFFFELHRRTGCFPYSFFKNKEYSEITFTSMKKHYDDSKAALLLRIS